MKSIKKLAGLLLALVMVFAMSVTAFAAETYSITVSNPTKGDTYSAYKIFHVSYADANNDGTNDAYSYTIKNTDAWWDDVLTYMGGGTNQATATEKGIYTGEGITLTPAAGQSDTYVVTVTTNATGVGAVNFSAPAFAEFLATKTGDKTAAATISNYSTGDAILNVDTSGAGYYLVTCLNTAHDKETTALAELNSAAPTVTITDKNVPPAFDKQQSDTGTDASDYTDEALDVQIGDTVDYRITSKVPDLTGYTKYTYEVSDILTEGLTLNMNATNTDIPDVTITVDGAEVDWPVTAIMGTYDANGNASEDADGAAIIGFRVSTDLVGKNYRQEADIVITYSAVVNEKALSDVETNTATLKYSNDPKDGNKTDTEQDETEVYDASIAVLKYDGATSDDGETPKAPADSVTYLSGAEFVLYKTEGDAPNTTTKYYKYEETGTEANVNYPRVTWVDSKEQATVLTTGPDGKLSNTALGLTSFAGLEDGTYYILETAAPAGYNLLDEPVEVVISKTTDSTTGAITAVSVTKPVANNAGTLLPATGGMGTTIFYILGGVLVLGAAVMLIVRRRMRAEK